MRYTESVNYANDPTSGKRIDCPVFEAITCYTSEDFVNWEYAGDVATVETLEAGPVEWVGRMGVVYHEGTQKYVLVSQYNDDSTYNDILIATSDNPTGPFKMEKMHYYGEVPFVNGSTGDQTMFTDDDGKDYLICSSIFGRQHLYIVPMKEDSCDLDFDNMCKIDAVTNHYFDEDGGTYLTWRLLESEDSIYGSAEENVEFNIYKNGSLAETEKYTTNYIDADETNEDKYNVAPVISGADIPTEYKIKTLMHDNTYRGSVAAQPSGYNQSPHVGMYMNQLAMISDLSTVHIFMMKN